MAGQDGKIGKLQVNEIDSLEVDNPIVNKVLRYSVPNFFGDPQDIPDKQYVDGKITGGEPILIEAGSDWPYPLVNGIDFDSDSTSPLVLQVVSKDDTKNTTNGVSTIVDYVFTDVTKTVLASINVYTTTSDGTTVDVDTWVRVV